MMFRYVALYLPAGADGPTIVERSSTDGLFIFDNRYSQQLHTQLEEVQFNDDRVSGRQSIIGEGLFISDDRRSVKEALIVDELLLNDTVSAVKNVVRSLSDGMFISDETKRQIVIYALDTLLLLDSVDAQKTEGGLLVVTRSAIDNLLLKDESIRIQQHVVDEDDIIFVDRPIKIEEHLIDTDNLLFDDDVSFAKIKVRSIADQLLLDDQISQALGLSLHDTLIFNKFIRKTVETVITNNVLLKDSSTATLTQAIISALVWAKITYRDLLGVKVGFNDNFLGTEHRYLRLPDMTGS